MAAPLYTAVIVCAQGASAEVLNVALPLLRVVVPRMAEPSKKVTVPVGVPEFGNAPLTVAVKVTVCLRIEGLTEEMTATIVGVGVTVTVPVALAEAPPTSVIVACRVYTPGGS